MENSLDQLRDYIASFRTWLETHASTSAAVIDPQQLQDWHDELNASEQLLEHKPEIPIAMLGPSQQGKSSLINALLGSPILAVGGAVGACTSVITSVHHSEQQDFSAEISFISLEAWRNELRFIRQNIKNVASEEDTAEDSEELRQQFEAAFEKLKAVYQIKEASDFQPEIAEAPDCAIDSEILKHMEKDASPLRIEEKTAIGLRNAVRRYMVGRNQHQDAQYWPLIKEIQIFGNFPLLSNGIVLVDLPGLDDPNPAREQVTREYLEAARYLWLVCNCQTGITAVFKRLLREERLLHRLFIEGRLSAFAVIATRADELNIDAVLQQMGKDPEEPYEPHEVLAFRNGQVMEEIRRQLFEIGNSIIERAAEKELGAPFLDQISKIPSFAIGSSAYMAAIGQNRNYQGLRVEETQTGVLGLKEHLKKITLEQSFLRQVESATKRLETLHKSVSSFFFNKTHHLESLSNQVKAQWERLQTSAKGRTDDTLLAVQQNKEVTKKTLEVRCKEFRVELANLDQKAIANLRHIFKQWEQMNWRTLKATVDRNGQWFSRSNGRRYDLASDVASSFVDLIPLIWDRFFSETLTGISSNHSAYCFHESELLVAKIRGQMDMMVEAPPKLIENLQQNIDTAQTTFRLKTEMVHSSLGQQVQFTRQTLTAGIMNSATAFMAPAFEAAKSVPSGPGIKARLLGALTQHVSNRSGDLFINVRRDLDEGILVLEVAMAKSFEDIVVYTSELIRMIASNVEIAQPPTPKQLEAYKKLASTLPLPFHE